MKHKPSSSPFGGIADRRAPAEKVAGNGLRTGPSDRVAVELEATGPLAARLAERDAELAAAHALLLNDIGLPDMSGLQVLEHIRRHGTSTEVVIFTNSTGPEMAARCRLLGANHFVDKAHDIRPIIESLRTITAPKDRI